MAPVVELIAARKRFGNVEAVRGVDLAIAAGEVVALLGPNGAGKTTSISLMLGLRQPTSGEARLFGTTLGLRTVSEHLKYSCPLKLPGAVNVPDSSHAVVLLPPS